MMRVHVHRYRVEPDVLEEFLRRREAAIDAVRALHPGLGRTALVRLDDGGYTDTWQWDSAEEQAAAWASLSEVPEAGAAMALTTGATAEGGEVVAFGPHTAQ